MSLALLITQLIALFVAVPIATTLIVRDQGRRGE